MHADRRLVATLVYLMLPSLAVMAQSNAATTDGTPPSDSFAPRQIVTDQDVPEVSTELLASRLAHLRQQASEFTAPRDNIVGLTRLVRQIAESGELPRDQLPRESKQPRFAWPVCCYSLWHTRAAWSWGGELVSSRKQAPKEPGHPL